MCRSSGSVPPVPKRRRSAEQTKQAATVFDSSAIPPISIEKYLLRLSATFRCSDATFIAALVIVDRLLEYDGGRLPLTMANVHRIFLASLVAAVKYNEDLVYSNSHYAKAGGVHLREVNRLERVLLASLDFDLRVEPEQYYLYEGNLRKINELGVQALTSLQKPADVDPPKVSSPAAAFVPLAPAPTPQEAEIGPMTKSLTASDSKGASRNEERGASKKDADVLEAEAKKTGAAEFAEKVFELAKTTENATVKECPDELLRTRSADAETTADLTEKETAQNHSDTDSVSSTCSAASTTATEMPAANRYQPAVNKAAVVAEPEQRVVPPANEEHQQGGPDAGPQRLRTEEATARPPHAQDRKPWACSELQKPSESGGTIGIPGSGDRGRLPTPWVQVPKQRAILELDVAVMVAASAGDGTFHYTGNPGNGKTLLRKA